jgi:hypothetical protein
VSSFSTRFEALPDATKLAGDDQTPAGERSEIWTPPPIDQAAAAMPPAVIEAVRLCAEEMKPE